MMGTRPNSSYCDDGNLSNNDGCSDTCSIESGFQCSGASSSSADTCTEICGDGKNYGQYGCDDGNLINGDGCSLTCAIESGFGC